MDGGQTWTTVRAPGGWPDTWQLQSIDCLSATTCWLAGDDTSNGVTPVLLETTDGGADWTTFTNLPGFTRYDPNGTYQLNAISCTSALECVAGGGLNLGDGLAQIITTTDGGATWTRSTDPMLTGLQMVFALSCLNGAGGLPRCFAAADANAGAGPVVINSADGGATWDGTETYDDTGWMYSIACPDTAHCWATGAGTTVGLAGTADGGSTWTVATSSTSNEEGSVACASVAFCVSTTDDALWQTTSAGASGGHPVSAAPPAASRCQAGRHPAAQGERDGRVGPGGARRDRNRAVPGRAQRDRAGDVHLADRQGDVGLGGHRAQRLLHGQDRRHPEGRDQGAGIG